MGNKPVKVDAAARDQAVAEFLTHVRPLDLIVVRGDGVSKMIMKIQKRINNYDLISHVEVAISKEYCMRALTDYPDMLTWGSTMSGDLNDKVKSIETNEARFGVQIRSLEDLAKVYYENKNANMGVCRLINNPTEKRADESDEQYLLRQAEIAKAIDTAYEKYNNKTYDANFISLLASIIPSLRPLRTASERLLAEFSEANQWLFCSEFVALVYKEVGVINDLTDGVADGKILDEKNVVPVDFLGAEQDNDGIMQPICEFEPIWLKPLKTTAPQSSPNPSTRT